MNHGSRKRITRIIGATLAALWAACGASAQAALAEPTAPEPAGLNYEFGRGLRLGDSGFTLGGYATAELRHLNDEASKLKSGHASAFVWWEGLGIVKAFAELDLLNATESHHDNDNDSDNDRRVSLERLYVDLAFADAFTLRAGKFLTPIGRWNVMHADPLVWTTTQPLVMASVFPHNLTGLMASGQVPLLGQALSYSVYASNGNEWRSDPYQDSFSRVLGTRLVLPVMQDLQLGVSLARYEQQRSRGESRRLTGVDLYWSRDRWELSAEWLRSTADAPILVPEPQTQTNTGTHPETNADAQPGDSAFGHQRLTTTASFVQGVVPLGTALYAVARLEWSRDPYFGATARQQVLGLAWRPNPGLSLKIEWLHLRTPGPASMQGLVASTSILF